MKDALFPLLLAALGLPVIVGGVALVARHLVYRHADQYGPAIAATGELRVANAEAARRMAGERHLIELKFEDDEYEYEIELEVEATR